MEAKPEKESGQIPVDPDFAARKKELPTEAKDSKPCEDKEQYKLNEDKSEMDAHYSNEKTYERQRELDKEKKKLGEHTCTRSCSDKEKILDSYCERDKEKCMLDDRKEHTSEGKDSKPREDTDTSKASPHETDIEQCKLGEMKEKPSGKNKTIDTKSELSSDSNDSKLRAAKEKNKAADHATDKRDHYYTEKKEGEPSQTIKISIMAAGEGKKSPVCTTFEVRPDGVARAVDHMEDQPEGDTFNDVFRNLREEAMEVIDHITDEEKEKRKQEREENLKLLEENQRKEAEAKKSDEKKAREMAEKIEKKSSDSLKPPNSRDIARKIEKTKKDLDYELDEIVDAIDQRIDVDAASMEAQDGSIASDRPRDSPRSPKAGTPPEAERKHSKGLLHKLKKVFSADHGDEKEKEKERKRSNEERSKFHDEPKFVPIGAEETNLLPIKPKDRERTCVSETPDSASTRSLKGSLDSDEKMDRITEGVKTMDLNEMETEEKRKKKKHDRAREEYKVDREIRDMGNYGKERG